MNGRPDIAWSRQLAGTSRGQVALWSVAGLLILSAHATAGWWVMRERPMPIADDAAPAIMVDLAALPMAPQAAVDQMAMDAVDSVAAEEVEAQETVEPVETVEPEVAEPVEAVEAEPVDELPVAETPVAEAVDPLMPEEMEPVEEPQVTAALSEAVDPEIVQPREDQVVPLPTPRPEPPRQQVEREERPKKQEQPRPRKEQPQAPSKQQTRAQSQVAQAAPRAAAPQAASGSGSSGSPARWQSRLMAHLERRKKYPSSARRARKEGVAQVRFSIDANGNVGSVALSRSSGVAELDAEVVSLVRRASPVPAPPPGVNRTIVVPIQFSLR